MKAKHENMRPKEQPADSTPIPTATPHEPPKRAKPVKGHLAGIRPYVGPHSFGERVMILDRVQVSVVLEDPFADHGSYPIELSIAEFEKGWTHLPTRTYVASEYERLGIKPPPDRDDRITTAEGLRAIYATMLRGAATAIEQKLQARRRRRHHESYPIAYRGMSVKRHGDMYAAARMFEEDRERQKNKPKFKIGQRVKHVGSRYKSRRSRWNGYPRIGRVQWSGATCVRVTFVKRGGKHPLTIAIPREMIEPV